MIIHFLLKADPRQIVVGKQQKMENETLLEGLHNILDDYRDGSQILRVGFKGIYLNIKCINWRVTLMPDSIINIILCPYTG